MLESRCYTIVWPRDTAIMLKLKKIIILALCDSATLRLLYIKSLTIHRKCRLRCDVLEYYIVLCATDWQHKDACMLPFQICFMLLLRCVISNVIDTRDIIYGYGSNLIG